MEKLAEIKSHNDINDSQKENHKIHHIHTEGCPCSVIEEDKIHDENGAEDKIKKSHEEGLLEVLFDSMEKVRKNEHRIASK